MSVRSEKRTFEDVFITDKQGLILDELKNLNGMITFEYDSVYGSKPDTVTEVYTFKKDGDTVGTITITYEDSSKEFILSAVKS